MISTKPGQSANNDPTSAFLDYFRCPIQFARFKIVQEAPVSRGFFRFGTVVCFGNISYALGNNSPNTKLSRALPIAEVSVTEEVCLPFDPNEVVNNLRLERYVVRSQSEVLLQRAYYLLRPLIPLAIRKRLQQRVSRSRRESAFPAWPVDCSVERIFSSLMQLTLQTCEGQEIPFIWFWPDGHAAALMMTHDVEDALGAAHCDMLMDMDDSVGLKSAFQLVPEVRYDDFEQLIARCRARGFEANLHDLDHDGRLYEDLHLFRKRSQKINAYAKKYSLNGFRAGAMHRNQNWFNLLEFQYEMSVPNVSHLEPQRGGCCTVTPYFVGHLLELPLTTVQDHGLFYILGEYSIDLWKQQIQNISAHNGLISFIIHPDYIVQSRERELYRELLQYFVGLRDRRNIWFALPEEINQWWRARSEMRLVRKEGSWQISGQGSERARLAFARMSGGEVEYRLAEPSYV
jgi:hypothetical protein